MFQKIIVICIITLILASILMVYNSIFNVLAIPVAGVLILIAYAKLEMKQR